MPRPRSAAPANSGPTASESNWADHLGKKISIRYRLDEPGAFSEAIGVVQAVHGPADQTIVEIAKRSGDVVAVETSAITHLKVF